MPWSRPFMMFGHRRGNTLQTSTSLRLVYLGSNLRDGFLATVLGRLAFVTSRMMSSSI